jgi:hypothetical protein
VRKSRGHSSAAKQLALLAYVRRLIPAKTPVLLVGDSEFGSVAVMRQLETWKWLYVLRHKANYWVKVGEGDWQYFGDLVEKSGQSYWLGRGLLTAKHAHPTNLLAVGCKNSIRLIFGEEPESPNGLRPGWHWKSQLS